MSTQSERIVIVGGGFGGMAAARQLAGSDKEVILVDRTNHHLFQPLLYQVATAALSPGDIAMPIRAMFSDDKNIRVMMAEVKAVQPDASSLSLDDGRTLSYDRLILAPGAQYNYFGNDHWKESAPGLKSISDALQIRERILVSLEEAEKLEDPEARKPYLTYVVIGGGPTGVEMAGAIAEIAKRNMMSDYRQIDPEETQIYLVEAMDRILNGYPGHLSEYARKTLEDMGVNVLLNAPVQDIRPDGVRVPERFIETPNIIWGAGVAASPLLESLGVERDRSGRVLVQHDLSLDRYPNIHVIGDAAHLKDENGNPYPALAPVALQQGRYVGKILKKETPPEKRKSFKYVDKGTMATIGRAKAVADVKGLKVSGFIAWILWSVIHIFFLIGFRNRFRVMAEWAWFYLTFRRGVRLITKRSSE